MKRPPQGGIPARPEVPPRGRPAKPGKAIKPPAGSATVNPISARAENSPSRTPRGAPTPQASRLKAARARREPDDASAARKKLAQATKARKTFEREEVRRFTAHLRRRRAVWLSGLGVFAALMMFVAVGAFTPVMALQEISVVGASRVPIAQIQASLQGEIGKPLPLVNFGAVRDAVAAQPLIKSYSTESLPPHTLLIRIVERAPVGYLTSDGGFTLVDPAGVVIETSVERIPGYPLFVVTGNSTDSLGFQAGIDVLNALPTSLAGTVDQVIATTTDDVVIVLANSGARVFWGGPDNAALKSSVLAALIASSPVGTVSEYDVSSPKTAVVR